jgi:ribosome-associated heat shock protein Hsp15
MSLRWDKYLWAVRLSKTRSQATESLNKGRIRINQQAIKPSRTPQIGDTIQVAKHNATFTYKVVQLLDKRVGAKLVGDYLLDTTTEDEREKLKTYLAAQAVYRQHGTGKPTKKDRRDIDDFLTDWEDDTD